MKPVRLSYQTQRISNGYRTRWRSQKKNNIFRKHLQISDK